MPAFIDPAGERLFNDVGLLEDLLEHEVLVAALLGGRHVPGDLHDVARDRRAVVRRQLVTVASDDDELALLQDDLFARVGQNRGRIRGDEHLAFADADDQRARTVTRENQVFRIVAGEHAQRVGAAYLGKRAPHGGFEVAVVVHLDQMRKDFGIGLALENVTEADQPSTQRSVVFDDAVMNDGDLSGAVHMRVRVGVRGTPVGCPARVAHADRPGEAFAVAQPLRQTRKLPLGFRAGQGAGCVDDGYPGAVVAAVL